ncbi:MAG: Acidobacterial duplicated orphan permease (function unknown) [uncultured Segetibacter sp.]|uniref:ABC transporter, permease protein n=1 Tax=uncultured Segetibacter sp. TaxID=481133 RepID=A0A6J4SVP5_9BACT|nr:MAG: Acidobacterial duplicated orphan permease (function unknown) [uncultured Segetibacter sp.]
MIKNYFKTAFRSLLSNKGYSFLNIFGLAIGIACAGLIFLWVENEVNYDKFNTKKDRLYAVLCNWQYAGSIRTTWSTPGLLGPAIKTEMPGIANVCRTSEDQTALVAVGNKSLYSTGRYSETSLFSMFTLPFAQGNANDAFKQPYAIVITEKAATKFFGNDKNVVGKTIRIDNQQDYIVSAILKDLPANSTLQFDWLAPFEPYFQENSWLTNWGNLSINTFIEVNPAAQPSYIDKQLSKYIQAKAPDGGVKSSFLFSMHDWHLHNEFENGKQKGGRIEMVRMLSLIAWFILLIACINFMNLATARSEKRSREVGVRKVLGAGRSKLVIQFMGEALLTAGVAAILAVFIISLALPAYNTLVEKDLLLDITNRVHISALLIIILVSGLVAGSYPSLYLSSFNPVFVLKGLKIKGGSATFIRKGLVVFQFTLSIVFIIGTLIIYLQVQHAKERDLGFNKDNLLELRVNENVAKHFSAVKQDLLNSGVVTNAALSSHSTIYGGNSTEAFTWSGKNNEDKILISYRFITPEFMSTSGMQIVEGRDFKPTVGSDSLNVIVTESLAKLMGNESAVGKTLDTEKWGYPKVTVIGVVKDFVYGDVFGRPDPVVFFGVPRYINSLYVHTKTGADTRQMLSKLGEVMKKNNPGYPFEYKFVDDQFNKLFLRELLMSKLAGIFATLAIIISCLGLFGLAAYTAERRTKEIGIRKVLGASAASLARLISKDFLKLTVISNVVAFPIAWLAMSYWLQSYSYRIELSWWIFIAAGLSVILIALFTVSFQAIKAAVSNPVKSLRTE